MSPPTPHGSHARSWRGWRGWRDRCPRRIGPRNETSKSCGDLANPKHTPSHPFWMVFQHVEKSWKVFNIPLKPYETPISGHSACLQGTDFTLPERCLPPWGRPGNRSLSDATEALRSDASERLEEHDSWRDGGSSRSSGGKVLGISGWIIGWIIQKSTSKAYNYGILWNKNRSDDIFIQQHSFWDISDGIRYIYLMIRVLMGFWWDTWTFRNAVACSTEQDLRTKTCLAVWPI